MQNKYFDQIKELIRNGDIPCYSNEEAHVFDHQDNLEHLLRFSDDRCRKERIKLIPKPYAQQRLNVDSYIKTLDIGKSLLIEGTNKDQLYWDIYRRLVSNDKSVDFFNACDLVKSWSSTYPKVNRYSRDRVYHVRYLMLLNIDKSCKDSQDIENLKQLIDARFKYNNPFIATSELDANTLDEALGIKLFQVAKEVQIYR